MTRDSRTPRCTPGEEARVARAVPKRRREFAAVRACARRAPWRSSACPRSRSCPAPTARRLRPAGLIGSMTHCDGYCAASLGLRHRPRLRSASTPNPTPRSPTASSLPSLCPPNRNGWRGSPQNCTLAVHWDRLLFSAKESVCKA
ncbi:hypothetical protein ACRAWF_06425 [Streptomyces sp. L7]